MKTQKSQWTIQSEEILSSNGYSGILEGKSITRVKLGKKNGDCVIGSKIRHSFVNRDGTGYNVCQFWVEEYEKEGIDPELISAKIEVFPANSWRFTTSRYPVYFGKGSIVALDD